MIPLYLQWERGSQIDFGAEDAKGEGPSLAAGHGVKKRNCAEAERQTSRVRAFWTAANRYCPASWSRSASAIVPKRPAMNDRHLVGNMLLQH